MKVGDGPELSTPCQELPLTPIAGGGGELWKLRNEDGLLSLQTADGRTVMMLPVDEAARNIRFEHDLTRGRVVSFSLAEGMRGHRFRCPKETAATLLAWLPQKPHYEQEREIVRSGAALVAFGTFQLLFPELFFHGWGLFCVAYGLVIILSTPRAALLLNGVFLTGLGALTLFLPLPERIAPAGPAQLQSILATAVGGIMLLWGVQQFGLLSPTQRLHTARTGGATPESGQGRSTTVLAIAVLSLTLAALTGAHTIGIYTQARTADTFAPADQVTLYAAPTLVLFAAGLVLLLRRRPAYTEAKLTGQFCIVLLVLYLAGFGACLRSGASPYPVEALLTGVALAVRLYIWVPILLLLLLFNRHYALRVRREVEDSLE